MTLGDYILPGGCLSNGDYFEPKQTTSNHLYAASGRFRLPDHCAVQGNLKANGARNSVRGSSDIGFPSLNLSRGRGGTMCYDRTRLQGCSLIVREACFKTTSQLPPRHINLNRRCAVGHGCRRSRCRIWSVQKSQRNGRCDTGTSSQQQRHRESHRHDELLHLRIHLVRPCAVITGPFFQTHDPPGMIEGRSFCAFVGLSCDAFDRSVNGPSPLAGLRPAVGLLQGRGVVHRRRPPPQSSGGQRRG